MVFLIAVAQQVSNVVLNTHFLTLILKLMKGNIVYGGPATARPTATNGTHANLVATMNTNAHQVRIRWFDRVLTFSLGFCAEMIYRRSELLLLLLSMLLTSIVYALYMFIFFVFYFYFPPLQGRILAATVLAMMLRYATILQPPTIRARDDHIVASIVALLKDSAKMDVRLKRRAVAALGETVFYISAQEEEVETSADRWTLPPQAVEALVDCLREENDETVKHYAVKVSVFVCVPFVVSNYDGLIFHQQRS